MTNYKNLNEALLSSSTSSKGMFFITGDNKETYLSYSELLNFAKGYLSILQNKGIKNGDHVVFQLSEDRDFIICFWACLLGGIVPVPVSAATNDENKYKLFKVWEILDSAYLISDKKLQLSLEEYSMNNSFVKEYSEIEQKTIFSEELNCDCCDAFLPEIKLESTAFIQFSSGSTGTPKGVVLTHENLLTNTHSIIYNSAINSQDISLSWMPLTHDMGLIGFHLTMLIASVKQCIIATSVFIRRPSLWIKKVDEHRVTITSSPNFGYKYFLSNFKPEIALNWDLSCVRIIYNGAEPISSELCYEFLNKLSKYGLDEKSILTVYGLAEASLAVSIPTLNEKIKYLNVDRNFLSKGSKVKLIDDNNGKNAVCFVEEGFPVINCYVRICDNDNNEVSELTIGSIQIKGKNVTKGYYNNKEATESIITPDGWLNTGDLGFMYNSKLIVTGREKEIIFINGFNYYPHDIERIAETIEGVELGKIVACGVNYKNQKEDSIVIFVYFKKGITKFIDIEKRIRTQIAEKVGIEITSVIPVKKIPKTTSGKFQRFRLAEMYLNNDFIAIEEEITELKETLRKTNIDHCNCTSTENKLISIYNELAGNKKISVYDNFFEIGANSLLLNTFTGKINDFFSKKVNVPDLYAYPNIFKLAVYLDQTSILKLPEIDFYDEFFNAEIDMAKNITYQILLDEKLYKKILHICQWKNISIYEYLLAIQLKLLSEETKQSEITIQTIIDLENCISNTYVDFNKVSSFDDLLIQIKLRDNSNIKINELDNISLKSNNKKINILFYNKFLKAFNNNLSNIFCITMEVSCRNNCIELYSDINLKLINEDKVYSFFTNYYNLIKDTTIKQYEHSMNVCIPQD